MSERGLLVKLGAVVEGSDYYRFLSWRRILFEEFGHELSPETGMEMSHLMPKVAARRLCRALGRLYTPAREDMWMNKLTRYYADYLSEVEEGDVLPRATRIGAYCREEDLRSCVIVPRGEGALSRGPEPLLHVRVSHAPGRGLLPRGGEPHEPRAGDLRARPLRGRQRPGPAPGRQPDDSRLRL